MTHEHRERDAKEDNNTGTIDHCLIIQSLAFCRSSLTTR
jgi:hypothetical protein